MMQLRDQPRFESQARTITGDLLIVIGVLSGATVLLLTTGPY
jgi:hypothetical protein